MKRFTGQYIFLLDENGSVVVKYVYNAWGNHAVLDGAGNDITDDDLHIGNLNPFRYRGYFYDPETELYYLQTRYYDPEVGRFITIDAIEYLDPESINGLNLYAYCGNNPVMATDETGTMPNWLKWLIGGIAFIGAMALTILSGGSLAPVLIGMGVSIISGALIQGTINAVNGGSFWNGVATGAADGALWGGVLAFAGAGIRIIQMFKHGVVIGESMSRVNAAANQIGAVTYKAPGKNIVKVFGKDKAFMINKSLNRAWINRMKRFGIKVTDIGLDLSREISKRSPFYAIEKTSINGYWNLSKMLFWS